MKKVLRNLALATAVLVAGSASAQTLTKVWEQTTDIAAGGEYRFCAGLNDKVLVNNKAGKQILYWDAENSKSVLHDLNDFFATNENLHTWGKAIDRIDTIVGAENDSTFDTIYKDVQTLDGFGTGIAVDDAGNILVNTGFPNTQSSLEFIIIPADGSEYIHLALTPVNSGRVDQFGRILGNMLSDEGAYVWLPVNGQSSVEIIKIVNGEQDMDYSMASSATTVTVNTSAKCVAAVETTAEIDELVDMYGDASASFWMRLRGNANQIMGWDTNEDEGTFTFNNSKVAFTGGIGAEGFAAFKLQGTWYFVVPTGDRALAGFSIVNEAGEIVAVEDNAGITNGGQFADMDAVKVDDYTANIYRWINGKAAMYTFTLPQPTPDVEPLYMVGQVNGNNWDISNPVEIPWNATSQCYEANLTIDGAEFKFSEVSGNGDWEAFNAKAICIADDQLVEYGNKAELWKYSGTNCKFGSSIEVGKEYNIKISVIEGSNVKGGYILVSESTGVENVEVEANAPAVYYNLQGVEVANPENGLYIVKQGNKVSKVLVK